MWTVGIETSCREGSVALLNGGELVQERSLSQEGRRHARTLVDELQQMLADAGVSPQSCEVVAVSRGPGSFTGLRVGVVCAKAWAYAAGCQVVGVDTLEAIAGNAPPDIEEVDVIADAQRGDVYHGRYSRTVNGSWVRRGDIGIVSREEWMSRVARDCVVTGPAAQICKLLPGRVRLLPEQNWFPRAAEVARIGRQRAIAGAADDAWRLEPLYLRRSAAEEKADG